NRVAGAEVDGDLGRSGIGAALRGVFVHVLLPGELPDLVHHLVDDLSQDQVVVAAVGVARDVDRSAEDDRDRLAHVRELGVGWHALACPADPYRDYRDVGAKGQPGWAGLAAVEAPVSAARALGVDAE